MDVFEQLNSHLFAQLDRLSGDISGDALKDEICRSVAVTGLARETISNCNAKIKALELVAEHRGLKNENVHSLLGNGS